MTRTIDWWKRGIIYQIYPRSFLDSNGDGVGDLPGIIQRLDYLVWLGIDAIWISPCYPSPMADFGYDISDYCNIDPIFGTLQDMDHLIDAAHLRQLKVILDFVPAHTSDQHPWFQESRSSRTNSKRDWYIWRDPRTDGKPPNNWLSHFDGKSAWKWDQSTGQYYLHTFLAEQPDLNWRNPEVQSAMLDVLRFWLDRGVDGFRIDVAHRIIKDVELRDNPPNPDWQPGMDPFKALLETYTRNRPEVHTIYARIRDLLDNYNQRMMVGEINVPVTELMKYYGSPTAPEFQLPFNFQLIHSDWNANTVRQIVDHYEGLLPDEAWPNWVLGNHDQHRFASRTSPAQSRTGMMLLLTLRGTPTIYYGDEIGMRDGNIPPDRVQDPWEINVPGLGLGRDPERTPMQWDTTTNAGFCRPGIEPWLPIAEDFESINVSTQSQDPKSILALTRALIALRRNTPVLVTGSYQSVETPSGVFAFLRNDEHDTLMVALNFTVSAREMALPEQWQAGRIRLTTAMDRIDEVVTNQLQLDPDEGLIVELL